jgi:hypothetical protein
MIYCYHTFIKKRFKLFLTFLALALSLSVYAQNEEHEKKLREMDVSVFGNKTLLNKAIVIDEMLEPFREKQKDKEGKYVYLSSFTWFSWVFRRS